MKKRFDWTGLWSRVSTWMSILTVAQGGAAAAFVAAPQEWRDAFPGWLGVALLCGSMATGAMVPVATSYLQKAKGDGR